MKKINFLQLFVFAMVWMLLPLNSIAQPLKVFVASDMHVMKSELIINDGPALEQYLAGDRKLLRESEAIFDAIIDTALSIQPDIVLFPGDLTKDGELVSHQYIAEQCQLLEDNGIQVFVVPGNHDINNPHAFAYDGEDVIPVDGVSPEDFSTIYANFGFNEAIAHDPNSLTYIVEPIPGFQLFAMDVCKYDDNYANNYPETGGRLKEESYNWIMQKLQEAKDANKRVLGMMHHGLVEHYVGQKTLFDEYVIDGWDTLSVNFADAGMKAVFTGHYHSHDIVAKTSDAGNTIYDVETGSSVTWPCPFRTIEIADNDLVDIKTGLIEEIDYDLGGQDFQDYAYDYISAGFPILVNFILTQQYGVPQELADQMNPAITEGFLQHYYGNETGPSPESQAVIEFLVNSGDPQLMLFGNLIMSIFTDPLPDDWEFAFRLKDPFENPNPMLTYLAGLHLGEEWDEGAAEISAYDAGSQKLFVTNAEFTTLDIVDLSNPAAPVRIDQIDITTYGDGLNSVAVYDGVVAAAVEADPGTDPGSVVFFDTDGNFLSQVTAGSLPDMVTFTHDGAYLLVANEGEPNNEYTIDPEGSISIIDMSLGAENLTDANVATADFTAFNGAVLDPSIRIFGPGASVAQDLEPEYIAVSGDNTTAFVTCQENNAFAVVDIATATVTELIGMGFKNHTMPGNGLDASNETDDIEIKNWPVYGMFQPDAVSSYTVDGETYYVAVNEGDARDYGGYSEEERVKDLDLDPEVFPNADWLQEDENLGRLKTTTANGDIDNDGLFEEIYSYGGRSFTIWDSEGNMVFDSQDDLEQITAGYLPYNFNSNNDENDSFKSRSDDKGPEPEAVTVAEIDGRFYAFIGLERVGGIMVYDVTNPMFPEFIEYRNDRNFSLVAEDDVDGHYAPEGILFIDAGDSPNGQALLVVSHEVSGTIAVYTVDAANAQLPSMLTIMHNNDGESQLLQSSAGPQWGGVANFKFKVDSLRMKAFEAQSPTVMLSSGDNFLPGPEFNASLNLPPDQPYYDAVAMDHIGYDAVCIGNHDFDFGPDVLEKFIRDYSLTQPPYLSANLDFSLEPGLQDLVDNGRIAASAVVNLNGTYVGVVGLTTPDLNFISSPRDVIVNDDIVNIAQAEIDNLMDMGLNKIILISHLQSIKEDSVLISQLKHVDIAIAGGGDELLTNDPSIALPGMDVYGEYPLEYEDADGETVYVVTTPGEYTYVGHLKAEFDLDGNVVSIDPSSNPVLVTNTTPDATLVELVEEPVSAYVEGLAQNIIATTEVSLDGIKPNLRTLETNEGDLVADALLWQATELAPDFGVKVPDVALQNGGGVRNNSIIDAGSDISELTTFDILPFPNFVTVIEDIPADQFKEILENAVSKVESVSGRFAQVAGMEFTWDPAGTAQEIDDETGEVTTPGTRVLEAKLADGTLIVDAGLPVEGVNVTVATIDFLAKGGDQYPFGDLEFTTLGVTYQQALYNYITQDKLAMISAEDYSEGGNARILNVNQQNVNTPEGWSIISGYIEPNNNDMEMIMEKVVDAGLDNDLEFMLNATGFYWPSQNINLFTDGWDAQSGYKIKMNGGNYFTLHGSRVEERTVELMEGVNYMPVPSVYPVDAGTVFSQIEEELIYAFDIENTLVYWPEGGLFTLNTLEPGKGYVVTMAAGATVDFSGMKSSAGYESTPVASVSNSPWTTRSTGNYHLIAVMSEAMATFEAGDIITVFTDQEEFAGQAMVTRDGSNTVLVAFGDDNTTEAIEGLVAGGNMNFILYRPETEEMFELEAEFNDELPNTDLFAENGASMITKLSYKATSVNGVAAEVSLNVYPNPNAGIFTIAASGIEDDVDIQVLNAQGQLVSSTQLIDNVEISIDLTSYPKGIYFVKAHTATDSFMQKVIVK